MTPPQSSPARSSLPWRDRFLRAAMHPRTTGLFCAVAAIAIVFGLGTSASAGPVSSQTFAPVADAFVSSLKPTTNFGSGPRLKMDKSPVLTTYIRFDPGVLSDPVTSSGSSGPTRSGRWTTVDVTSLVSGNGPVTIAVTTSSMPELDVDSRQSTKSPKLTVQTSSGDVSAPTVPGNLALTSAAASSLSASWSASTDDTGVVGYDLYLNSSAAGSTAGTSYNFGSLSCGTKYTIGVAAYDAAGNHSPRASLDATTSACPDTQPPSAPTNLAASGATQTSLNLSWSASADNLGVAGYHVFASNTSVGSTGATSYTFNNLTCGTIYTLGVEAYDAAGNVSARSTLTAGTTACSASTTPPPYRFLYNSDSAPATVASYGWNLIDVGSQWSADQLQAGSRGLVWVGDYDNTTCSWEESDAALNSQVTAARGDAKVFGYFISDEPNPYACPNAPAQHKARSDLIHSI
ncbi:MAG: fibronectin type III domain-containing protein, partial [Actinobacteria bacterium]